MVHSGLRFAVTAAGFLLSAQAALAESRVALVIGQSAYRAVPALTNPANDAKAMTQLLTDAGFDVVTASDLSQNEMREKVSDFAGRTDGLTGRDVVCANEHLHPQLLKLLKGVKAD